MKPLGRLHFEIQSNRVLVLVKLRLPTYSARSQLHQQTTRLKPGSDDIELEPVPREQLHAKISLYPLSSTVGPLVLYEHSQKRLTPWQICTSKGFNSQCRIGRAW
ncbi:uncharacterized protein BDCG_16485, partial [Blastomyces dermatitidis ER-3]